MALSNDTHVKTKGDWEVQDFQVVASEIIYKGAMVAVDGNGFLTAAADTAGLRFAGIAMEQGDNSSGASGDITVNVAIPKGGARFHVTAVGAAQTDVGEICYVTDDESVGTPGTDPGNAVVVGRCIEIVSATEVVVDAQAFGVNA